MKGEQDRIAAVGARWSLTETQVAALGRLVDLLGTEGPVPTAVRDPGEATDVHLADSLSGLEVNALRAARRAVDIGSGAGFPGLPLAIALPQCEWVLLEAQRRRCEFLAAAISSTGAENAHVQCSRAESWAEGAEWADAATARALAPQPVALEWAAPLLKVGGTFVDWRGARRPEEERDALAAADALGFGAPAVLNVVPFAGAREHHLHVFVKERPTPARYPRREGIARKRPLH